MVHHDKMFQLYRLLQTSCDWAKQEKEGWWFGSKVSLCLNDLDRRVTITIYNLKDLWKSETGWSFRRSNPEWSSAHHGWRGRPHCRWRRPPRSMCKYQYPKKYFWASTNIFFPVPWWRRRTGPPRGPCGAGGPCWGRRRRGRQADEVMMIRWWWW